VPAQVGGQALQVALGLLHANDVCAGCADGIDDAGEAHVRATPLDVERHDAERDVVRAAGLVLALGRGRELLGAGKQ
jgi:hypothetical protein